MKPSLTTPSPAELHAQRVELESRPPSEAATALRALAALEDTSAADDADLPEMPRDLRDQWRDAYGKLEPAFRKAPAPTFLERIASLLQSRRFVLGGGLAVAALVAVAITQQGSGPGVSGPNAQTGPTLRGGPVQPVATGAYRLVLIAPADQPGFVEKFNAAWSTPRAEIAADAEVARQLMTGATVPVIVANGPGHEVSLWRGPRMAKSLPTATGAEMLDSMISQIEAAAEAAKAAPVVPAAP